VVQILVRNGSPMVTQRFNDIHTFDTVAELITAGNIAEERNRNDERYRRMQQPPPSGQPGASSSNTAGASLATGAGAMQKRAAMEKEPRKDGNQPWYRRKENHRPPTSCSVCGDDPAKCRGVCGRCKQHGHRKDTCPMPVEPPQRSPKDSNLN
jgi:hypothetical protein